MDFDDTLVLYVYWYLLSCVVQYGATVNRITSEGWTHYKCNDVRDLLANHPAMANASIYT